MENEREGNDSHSQAGEIEGGQESREVERIRVARFAGNVHVH